MRAVLTFLFGTGWWTLWHLFILVWLLPVGGLLAYFKGFKPGKGPQGGEVMFLLLIFVIAVVVMFSLVDALLWARSLPAPGLAKYAKAAGIWLITSIAWIILIVQLVERSTTGGESSPARMAAIAALGVTFAALFALNLFGLWRFHQAKRTGYPEAQAGQEIRAEAAQSAGKGLTRGQ